MSGPPGRVPADDETVSTLLTALDAVTPHDVLEARDIDALRSAATSNEVWSRSSPLHATGSALVVHPRSRRVLLRWHTAHRCWLHVGGHADPGEHDPAMIAHREAVEESGLTDLVFWPNPGERRPIQVVVVPVAATEAVPAHEHGDIRYLLATDSPETATAEKDDAPLRWLSIDEATDLVTEDNVRELLRRTSQALAR